MMGAVYKASPSLMIPVVSAYDMQWGASLAFGLVSGWFCRAAIPYMNERSWAVIKREFIVSAMISGGSLLATLWIARMLDADVLAVGGIAWAVSFGGIKALSLFRDYVILPVRHAVGKSPEEIMGEKRQEAAKMVAAARQAEKDADDLRELDPYKDEKP